MSKRVGLNLSWVVVLLLLLINMDNNLDRQVYALTGSSIQREFHWRESDYAAMVAAFQFAFALTSLGCGFLIDLFGERAAMATSIAGFSAAQIGHALARGPMSFGIIRVMLAVGEAPTYPATLKVLAQASPQTRASAAGWVHFGVMLGPILAPLAVPLIASRLGWRAAFVASGLFGLMLIVPWLLTGRSKVQGISQGPVTRPRGSVSHWGSLMKKRQLWTCVVLQTLPNPAWWFLIYWLPKFLKARYGITGVAAGHVLTFVYIIAAGGALIGGRFSGMLLKRGCDLNVARKTVLLGCGLVMPVVLIALITHSAWLAALAIGFAAAVHQTWTATGAAVVGDLFESRHVGSVVGISSFFGSLAGVGAAEATGWLLDAHSGDYRPMFIFSAFIYLTAVGLIQLLSPSLKRAAL